MIEPILVNLREMSSDKYRQNVIKLGIPAENSIGVATGDLRKLAKKLPRHKDLVEALWLADFHETRILAVLVMVPEDYTFDELAGFMDGIISWDLCDLMCKTVLITRKDFDSFITRWVVSEALYFKRAAFTLIASMSTHHAPSQLEITDYLTTINEQTDDDRLLVKKAASWALRELGKIDEESQRKALVTAQELVKSGTDAQQWVARDALKELTTLVRVAGRSRLISNKSKMGKLS